MVKAQDIKFYKLGLVTQNMINIKKKIEEICKSKRETPIYFHTGENDSGKTFYLMYLYHEISDDNCIKTFIDGSYIKKPIEFFTALTKGFIEDEDFLRALKYKQHADYLINKKEGFSDFGLFFNKLHSTGGIDSGNFLMQYSSPIFGLSKKIINKKNKKIFLLFIDDFDILIEECGDYFLSYLKKILDENKYLILITSYRDYNSLKNYEIEFRDLIYKNIKDKEKKKSSFIIEPIDKKSLVEYVDNFLNNKYKLNFPINIINEIINKIGARPYYIKMLLETFIYFQFHEEENRELKNDEDKILALEKAYIKMLYNLTSFFKERVPDSILAIKILDVLAQKKDYMQHKNIAEQSKVDKIYLGTILQRLLDANKIQKKINEKGEEIKGFYKIKDPVFADWFLSMNKDIEINLI